MIEHYIQCPHCWEEISMLLDPSISSRYVEDCEVCCNPIQITVQFENMILIYFRAESIEQ